MARSIVPSPVQADALDALCAAMALFAGGDIKLYQNNVQVDADTVIGDLEEADYTGYADQAVGTWLAAGKDAAGMTVINAPLKQFTASGTAVSNTIYGYYLTDSMGALLAVWPLDTPVVMGVDVERILPIIPQITWGF